MTARWVPYEPGQEEVVRGFADGLHSFASLAADNARNLSPRRWRNTGRYRRSIKASTFLRGALYAGQGIRATGFTPGYSEVHSIVYTTDFQGHMLEVTGARPHDIPIGLHNMAGGRQSKMFVVIKHPGFTRKPHFLPGLLQAASQAGAVMKGKRLAMAGKYGR